MQVNEVKRQIQAKRLDCFYVFTGEEIEAQRIYINKISEVTNKPVKRIDSAKDAFNKRASIFKTSNIYVCRDDIDFWKSATDVDVVSELLGDNILILQMTDIDKRSKSYKTYSSQIVEFKYMDADTLYKYAHRACSMSDESIFNLIEMCENDYSRVLLEANKVCMYARAGDIDTDEAFLTLAAKRCNL